MSKYILLLDFHPSLNSRLPKMAFLPPPSIRKTLAVPTQDKVDFRAACFCHKNIVDIGFVCSVCLSSEPDLNIPNSRPHPHTLSFLPACSRVLNLPVSKCDCLSPFRVITRSYKIPQNQIPDQDSSASQPVTACLSINWARSYHPAKQPRHSSIRGLRYKRRKCSSKRLTEHRHNGRASSFFYHWPGNFKRYYGTKPEYGCTCSNKPRLQWDPKIKRTPAKLLTSSLSYHRGLSRRFLISAQTERRDVHMWFPCR